MKVLVNDRRKKQTELFNMILEIAKNLSLQRKAKFGERFTAYYLTRYWSLAWVFSKIRDEICYPEKGPALKLTEIHWWEKCYDGQVLNCPGVFRGEKFLVKFYFDKKKARIQVI